MKQFLRKILTFAVACSIVLLSLHVIHAIREYHRFVLPKGKSIVAISNSHMQCAITDENWPELINLSSSGCNPWVWHAKLRTLIDQNPTNSIKYLLISFGVIEATRRNSEEWESKMFARYFPMPLFVDAYPYSTRKTLLSGSFMDALFSINNITGKWTEPPPPDCNITIDVQKTISNHFGINEYTSDEPYDIDFESLTKMIQLATDHHIKVVLLSTPFFKPYRELIPKAAKTKRDARVMEIQSRFPEVLYLDFYELESLDRQDYRDANHLSSSGRKKLSKLVKAELKQIEQAYLP